MSLCTGSALIFLQLSRPLRLGVIVAIFSILVRLSIYLINPTVWFSLLLVLLFLRGIMVIFVYVASLAHNEPYLYHLNYRLLTIILIRSVFIFNEKRKWGFLRELRPMDLNPHFVVYKVYSFGIYLFTTLLISYLFIRLVVVVKLATSREVPLRVKK
jgi:NADH-ubiquinone oxidoreductase chain 6